MKIRTLVIVSIVALFFIFSGDLVGQNSDSINLKAKSRKNWFAKNIKVSSEQVNMQDLLQGPKNDWLV